MEGGIKMAKRIYANGNCPFCKIGSDSGNKNLIVMKRKSNPLESVYLYQIKCTNCGSRGPTSSSVGEALREFICIGLYKNPKKPDPIIVVELENTYE